MNTGQTDRFRSKSLVTLVMLSILAGLSGLVGTPFLVYYLLGKLETDSLRQIACGSICLVPVITLASFAFSWMLYKANRKGQDSAVAFASSAWSEVAGGLFKVAQAREAREPRQPRQPDPMTTYLYPMPTQLPQPAGMLIEQRAIPGQEFYE